MKYQKCYLVIWYKRKTGKSEHSKVYKISQICDNDHELRPSSRVTTKVASYDQSRELRQRSRVTKKVVSYDKGRELVTRGFDDLTRDFYKVTRGFDVQTHAPNNITDATRD